MLELLRDHPAFFVFSATLFGLLIGSFLNVVIHRLPKMMEAEWRSGRSVEVPAAPRGTVTPRSSARYAATQSCDGNIPVLSYSRWRQMRGLPHAHQPAPDG